MNFVVYMLDPSATAEPETSNDLEGLEDEFGGESKSSSTPKAPPTKTTSESKSDNTASSSSISTNVPPLVAINDREDSDDDVIADNDEEVNAKKRSRLIPMSERIKDEKRKQRYEQEKNDLTDPFGYTFVCRTSFLFLPFILPSIVHCSEKAAAAAAAAASSASNGRHVDETPQQGPFQPSSTPGPKRRFLVWNTVGSMVSREEATHSQIEVFTHVVCFVIIYSLSHQRDDDDNVQ
jgi:hypothetical protein